MSQPTNSSSKPVSTSRPLSDAEIDAMRRKLYPRRSACRGRCRRAKFIY